LGLNGIYPVNFYPYNIQIRKKLPVDAEQKQNPETDSGLQDQQSSSGYKASIDYSKSDVNISQVIFDFKNTLKAIGASKEVNDEVETYLNLVEIQASKENASQRIIRSNLKNAAAVLDTYISETLNKPSNVVNNWIDALLLQKIDYKTDKPIPATIIQSHSEEKNVTLNSFQGPSGSEGQATSIQSDDGKMLNLIQHDNSIRNNSPENAKLEELYNKASKVADSGNYTKALSIYEKLIPFSQKVNNPEIQAKLYMDKAYIHDINGDFVKALDSYNNAANLASQTGNQKVQAEAHYNIGAIYDDFGKTDAALNHYYESLSLDGQVENLRGQTLTLNDVGNIYSGGNDYKQALDHYKVGFALTNETRDNAGKSCILSNVAGVFRDIGQDDKALKYYRNSIKIDSAIGNTEGYAKSYEQAGDIMFRNNMTEKAGNLYKKSLLAAQKVGDQSWASKILDKLQQNSISY